MIWKRTKGIKYSNKKISHSGYSFASKLEAALFDHLKLREQAGFIADLKVQDTVYLTEARIMYKPDFRFFNLESERNEWAESKGFETSDWRIKRRLWECYGPGKLWIYAGTATKLVLKEVLQGAA